MVVSFSSIINFFSWCSDMFSSKISRLFVFLESVREIFYSLGEDDNNREDAVECEGLDDGIMLSFMTNISFWKI